MPTPALPVRNRYANVRSMTATPVLRLVLICVASAALTQAGCGKKDKDKNSVKKAATNATGATKDNKFIRAEPTNKTKPPTAKNKPPLKNLATDTNKSAVKHAWSLRFGNKKRDNGRGIATDSKGNIYLTGLFSGKVDFGNKKPIDSGKLLNVFLAKYDSEGTLKWVKSIGNKGEEDASAVTVDKDDNVIIAGLFSEQLRIEGKLLDAEREADNIFVAKWDSSGKLQWAKDFGADGNDVAHGLATDSAGNIILTGRYQQFIDFGKGKLRSNGNNEIFITKLTPAGELLWARSIGALHDDVGRAVAVDVQDNIYLGADITTNTMLDGKKLDIKGQTDAGVIKFDANGNVQWATTWGGAFQEILVSLAVDPAGGVIAVGAFKDKMVINGETHKSKGGSDMFVVKLDTNGKVQWARTWGDRYKDIAAGVSVNKFGTIAVTGWFERKVNFGGGVRKSEGNKDVFLLKLDRNGKYMWDNHFGAKGDDTGRGVIIDDSGVITLSGTFRFDVTFGGRTLESARELDRKLPAGDAFLARFTP